MGNNRITLDVKENDRIYQNTNQEWIVTTKDKLKIVLMESEKSLGVKKIWITPLGLFLNLFGGLYLLLFVLLVAFLH